MGVDPRKVLNAHWQSNVALLLNNFSPEKRELMDQLQQKNVDMEKANVELRQSSQLKEAFIQIANLKGWSFAEGAAFAVGYKTAYHAIVQRGHIKPREVLLVHGASGGVGLAAVELGKVLGARVIATGSDDARLEVVREKGADFVINYREAPFAQAVKDLTDGRGADVIYDPVGGELAEPALRSMAWGGRYLVIGFAAGDIPRIPLNLPLLKGCSIVGVSWGAFSQRERDVQSANATELWQMFEGIS